MTLQRTPLEPAVLSEAARRALSGPAAMKMMAARGLAPLPRPVDLVSVIYQLALDTDGALQAAAEKTAGDLPEKILAGALADASLDARVLDFFAPRVLSRPPLLEALLLNRNTSDTTIQDLAAKVGEMQVEIIAANEQRLVRAPGIIYALYINSKARMSTIDRALELAVRNNLVVQGIRGWDEIVAQVMGTQGKPAAAELDAAFSAAAQVGVGEAAPPPPVDPDAELPEAAPQEEESEDKVEDAKEKLQLHKLTIPAKIRLATIGNSFARATLIRDTNKQVALAAIRSPGVTDNEVVKFSANRGLSDDVVREMANTREWTRIYQIKVNLVNNPKTPLQSSMRFLPFLHDRELRAVARSRGIPSALVQQAQKLISAKSGGKK